MCGHEERPPINETITDPIRLINAWPTFVNTYIEINRRHRLNCSSSLNSFNLLIHLWLYLFSVENVITTWIDCCVRVISICVFFPPKKLYQYYCGCCRLHLTNIHNRNMFNGSMIREEINGIGSFEKFANLTSSSCEYMIGKITKPIKSIIIVLRQHPICIHDQHRYIKMPMAIKATRKYM